MTNKANGKREKEKDTKEKSAGGGIRIREEWREEGRGAKSKTDHEQVQRLLKRRRSKQNITETSFR